MEIAMQKVIITIARQYGSGGREIGERVAELLGIAKYDKEFVTITAQEDETLSEEALAKVDERATSSLLYTLAMGSNLFGVTQHNAALPLNDRLFAKQSALIHRLADKDESCVMIGRCADYVLRDCPNRLSVFVYANIDDRKKRVAERHNISESAAIDIINKTIELKVSDEELAARRAKWVCPEPKITTGYLARYAKLVSSADKGAILE